MNADFRTVPPIEDLEGWLTASEAAFADIRPGLAKEIIWTDRAAKRRTPLSILYIHGFSASKGEVRPLPDLIARALGANLFYTRLAGHGRSGDAMAEATVADWKNDIEEGLSVASRIGEKTIVLATSTGATLAAWALSQPAMAAPVAGAIFLSPNFRIKGRGAGLLTAPFAAMSARLLLGHRRRFVPLNALHAAYWTTDYPVLALLPMARLVRESRGLPFERIAVPAMFVYSNADQVVDPGQTASVASRWGAHVMQLDPALVGDPHGHLIAGDALSPATTERIAGEIIKWIRNGM